MKYLPLIIVAFILSGCTRETTAVSMSGAKVTSAGKITLGPSGLTSEQQNIQDRIQQDNKPGAIKHLYIISAYSGQCILYSTVRGKVTSSGKRLLPEDAKPYNDGSSSKKIMTIVADGKTYTTSQLPGEDGTYGSSVPYIYWFDARGTYHQHYIDGGQIVHVSSEPIEVKNVIINLEQSK